MKRIIQISFTAGVLLFGLSGTLFSQSYQWKPIKKYSLEEQAKWSVDGLSNLYISNNSVISKIDSTGSLKFQQSIKSLGDLSQILPINTMKLVHFSEEQQTLCYFDNTLTQNEDCIELIDRDVLNATEIATSERSDMLWVYDEINSRLSLFNTEGNDQQNIRIENIRGILGTENVDQLIERGNKLYLLDKNIGVFILDIYGSLINKVTLKDAKAITAGQSALYVLFDDHISVFPDESPDRFDIQLPIENVLEFEFKGGFLYLRTPKNVHKFRLQSLK